MFIPAKHLVANMALSFTSPVNDHKHHILVFACVVKCIAEKFNIVV